MMNGAFSYASGRSCRFALKYAIQGIGVSQEAIGQAAYTFGQQI